MECQSALGRQGVTEAVLTDYTTRVFTPKVENPNALNSTERFAKNVLLCLATILNKL